MKKQLKELKQGRKMNHDLKEQEQTKKQRGETVLNKKMMRDSGVKEQKKKQARGFLGQDAGSRKTKNWICFDDLVIAAQKMWVGSCLHGSGAATKQHVASV